MAVWSNIALSAVQAPFGRFDAEFYKPEFLDTDRVLAGINGVRLRDVASKIAVGHVGPMVRHYSDSGILLLQTQNVREFFLALDHSIRITPSFHASLRKSQVRRGDILIARSGSFGSAAIYLEDEVINSADIIIVDIDDPRINSLFAVAFINTRHGSAQLARFASGGVQGHVNLRILENFQIPVFDMNEQLRIAEHVKEAYAAQNAGAESYAAALKLLEKELGLDKPKFQKPTGNIAKFSIVELSEIFSARRVDAQCFSPDARFYKKWLLENTKCTPLGRMLKSVIKGQQQTETQEGTIDYCSIKHIGHRELENVSSCNPKKNTPIAVKNDLLLAITGATIGKIGIVKGYEKLTFSGDLLCLRPDFEIEPNYLLLVLDHHIGQIQFNRWITGSTNGHLAPSDVKKILIPRIKNNQEKQIAKMVEDSISKRLESERLLEKAKTRVEQLIEKAVAS